MSLFNSAANLFDRAMGVEVEACAPDHPEGFALVKAGLALLDDTVEVSAETKLSALGEAPVLMSTLNNLEPLYAKASDSLGADIIHNVNVGTLVSHLSQPKVETVVAGLIKEEKATALVASHEELDRLTNQMKA